MKVRDFTLNKVLDKVKKIAIKILDNIRILINTNGKLPYDNTLQNAVILMTCAVKDSSKLYPQLFLEESLHNRST